jgi:proline iminopeptidase
VLYAADNPGSVAGMILTGPGPIIPVHPELARVAAPDSLHLHDPYYSNRQGNELANNIRTRAMALLAAKYGIKLASDDEADDFAAYLNHLVNRSTVADTSHIQTSIPGIGAGYYDQVMTAQSFSGTPDPRPKLKNSTIPILVMKGQYDNQKWGFTHEYLDLFPRHRLVVFPNAGHCIACEQLQAYQETIRSFLKGCR